MNAAVPEDVVGTYQGLLSVTPEPAANEPTKLGRFTVKVSSTGRFSGVLEYRGLRHRMTGAFSAELTSELTIERPEQSALTVKLQLLPDTDALSVEVEEAFGGATSTGSDVKHSFDGRANRCDDAGRYTMRFASLEEGTSFSGYASATVSDKGVLKFAGRLSDGTPVKGSGFVNADGSVSLQDTLYRPVFPDAGQLIGAIQVDREALALAVTGNLEWQVPNALSETAFLTVMGSTYVRPVARQRVIDSPTGSLIFNSSEPVNFSNPVLLTTANRFQVAEPNEKKLKITIALGSGVVTGKFFDSQVNRVRVLRGIVLQTQRTFHGFFLTEVAGGTWEMKEF